MVVDKPLLDPPYPKPTVRFVDVSIGQIDVYHIHGAKLGQIIRNSGGGWAMFRSTAWASADDLRQVTEKLEDLNVSRVSGDVPGGAANTEQGVVPSPRTPCEPGTRDAA